MRPATKIVKRVLQTEKAARVAPHQQYVVEVALDANKVEIQQAVEQLFNVHVSGVNTVRCHGKWRRLGMRAGQRSDWKKAFVTVAEGEKIEVKP